MYRYLFNQTNINPNYDRKYLKKDFDFFLFKRLLILIFVLIVFYTLYTYLVFHFIFNFVCMFYNDFLLFLDSLFFFVDNTKYIISEYLTSNKFLLLYFFFFMYIFNISFLTIATFFFGLKGIFIVSFLSIIPFWAVQFFFLKDLFFNSAVYYLCFDFLNFFVGSVLFSFSFKIDFINFSFLFLTTTIGLCAIVYSLSYFKNEPHADRFILLLNWFIISMSLLVLSDNALLLFLGWELIGLTSFLLINFWTVRRGTLKSAFKAFTFNKISDVFLLFFIIIIAHQTNSLNLTTWQIFFLTSDIVSFEYINLPGLFLIFASSIKSAQIFGHLWLPDSMEAPIPASALIHSATLVSAGVYLLLKFNWLVNTNFLSYIIFLLGGLTSMYGALVSAAQTDCKKLLAYSTISHCGFLFITISLNNAYLTITYLYLHGFFKALTFFCVGNLVKVSKGYQDTRKMGQLFILLPIESILFVLCAVNLGALPFTVGYFYKYLFQSFFLNADFIFFLYPFLLFSMLTSIVYVYRLIFYSLFDIQKNNDLVYNNYLINDYARTEHSNSTILGSLFIFMLCTFSIFVVNLYVLYIKDFLIFNLTCDYQISEIGLMFTPINRNYLILFYVFYLVMIFILTAIECRVSFNYLKTRDILFFIFCSFFLWQFFLIATKYFSFYLNISVRANLYRIKLPIKF